MDPGDRAVDVHTHVVPGPTPFLERLSGSDPRWARLVPRTGRSDVADVIVADRVFRTVRRVAYDLDARHAEQLDLGCGGQVLSAMPELFALWAPPAHATDYCRAFNDWLRGQLEGHDGFFAGLGIVPLQDPDAAAGLLAEVRRLGLLGIEIPSAVPEAPLHDPRFDGFFREAERLGLLVFVHSVGRVDSFNHPMAGTSAVFPSRIGEAVAGLIANGVAARYPDLRLLVSHGGGSLPASLARLDFVRTTTPQLREYMPEPATAYARRFWYDPLLFDAALVELLAGTVGSDRVVLGSDYPFLHGDPNAALTDPRLPGDFASRVRSRNPRRLLEDLAAQAAQPIRTSGGL
jgi:aminocarboxymuconate-semialdehyde decarboxylase